MKFFSCTYRNNLFFFKFLFDFTRESRGTIDRRPNLPFNLMQQNLIGYNRMIKWQNSTCKTDENPHQARIFTAHTSNIIFDRSYNPILYTINQLTKNAFQMSCPMQLMKKIDDFRRKKFAKFQTLKKVLFQSNRIVSIDQSKFRQSKTYFKKSSSQIEIISGDFRLHKYIFSLGNWIKKPHSYAFATTFGISPKTLSQPCCSTSVDPTRGNTSFEHAEYKHKPHTVTARKNSVSLCSQPFKI